MSSTAAIRPQPDARTDRDDPVRFDVVAAAILARLRELAEDLKRLLGRTSSFGDALLEGSIGTVVAGRGDPELTNLISTANSVLRETFDRARSRGEMRRDISDDELIEWISGVYLMLILREDLTRERERHLVDTFLLPAALA